MIAIDFSSLQSEAICLRTMHELHPQHPKSKLYRNASKAAASARLACSYNKSALTADLEISPLLHYYSLLQSLKSLMFIRDVDYPIATSVLQHGVSVRRSKKESYSWAHDYVHVYKDGVLQSYAELENYFIQAGSRYFVGELIGSLPHMVQHVELFHDGFTRVYPIVRADGSRIESFTDPHQWFVSRKAAARRRKTLDEWKAEYIRANHSEADGAQSAGNSTRSRDKSQLNQWNADSTLDTEPVGLMSLPHQGPHPWITSSNDGLYIFDGQAHPRWLMDFVLLYTLSSLSRYNPVEWSDIILWNNESDAYLVRHYLQNYQPLVSRAVTFL